MLLTVVYVIMPVDFVPDVIVIVGWIDDLIALLAAGTGLLLAFRRFQREQGAALQTPQESYITPGVVETQGTEVR
ncbi:MAG: DUF1232 domain-containing protein [Myxococcales bacterium]|nr:DUF1232 domain-containing protein [Myxococcales bacterium]